MLRQASVLCAALLAPAAACAQALEPAALLRMLAAVESSNATFVETRHSALLKAPLVLRGTLAYKRPAWLEKHVRAPHEQRIVLDGEAITFQEGAAKPRRLNAGDAAPLAALVAGIRATRAGDRQALDRHFELRVEGRREQWVLSLKPTDEEVARYVSAITVSGSLGRVTRVEIAEASGDRSVMEVAEEIR